MDRRTRTLFAVVLVVVIGVTGGAALILGGWGGPAGGGGSQAPGTQAMVGVIVEVEAEGLSDVRGFTLRLDDSELVPFELGRLENASEFPPGHLAEHQATAERVQVWFRVDGGSRVAVRLEDAE